MSVTVRPTTAADAGHVLGFIRGLAEYEGFLDECEASEASVLRDLYGAAPRVFADIAELDGRPVGMALWFYNYSTFLTRHGIYLEDLFVIPEARGEGAGLALLKGLARRCLDESLGRVDWLVLDWNAPAIQFYDALGADSLTEWTGRRLEGAALAALAAS